MHDAPKAHGLVQGWPICPEGDSRMDEPPKRKNGEFRARNGIHSRFSQSVEVDITGSKFLIVLT